MTQILSCDICGRSAEDLSAAARITPIQFTKDADDLWVCSECQSNLKTIPVSTADEDELDARIKRLIGVSAGAICRTTNLPFVPPYRSIIEAAERIAYDDDRYMSAWSLVTQWADGTTIWQSEDGNEKAIVDTQGNVRIERDY